MCILCLIVLACSLERDAKEATLTTLRIGVLPGETKERLVARHSPLAEYLAREIGIPCKLIIPDSYEELVEQFHDGEIDLAYFGGFTFVQAHRSDGAVPLVMRDVDARFTTYFLVRGDNSAQMVKDFKGKSFSFGPRLSTSGHLMPRHFLLEQGIVPEDFFREVQYSGTHDKLVLMVRDKVIDLGVANSLVVQKMFDEGTLAKDDVRVLWETPPYANYVWAIRPIMGEALQIQIRDAFLALSRMNREHAEILSEAGAGHFLPASSSDFILLEQTIDELHLLGEP